MCVGVENNICSGYTRALESGWRINDFVMRSGRNEGRKYGRLIG